jgi:hypothetical protein
MRSSLIVLAIVLATLRALEAALGRARRAARVPAVLRRGAARTSELSLAIGVAARSRRPEAGWRRGVRGRAADGGREASGFTEWRYYGFSHHAAETEASAEEPSEVVASSPAVGSVVTILPDDCITTVVNGCVYRQCGSVWYQRQYTGSNVTYVVVRAP